MLGLAWIVLRGLRDVMVIARHARRERGVLVYGVYQDDEGRWMVYRHGRAPREIDWENPPPKPAGRGPVVEGAGQWPGP